MNVLLTTRHYVENGCDRYFSNKTYVDALQQAGLNVSLAVPSIRHNYDELADHYDGLVLSGGDDVDPSRYSQDKHDQTNPVDPCIDEMDFALLAAFIKRGKPILGICRGLQVINVYFGGTLKQHIDEAHRQKSDRSEAHHKVYVENSPIWNKEHIKTNSLHHQSIDKLADGFEILGKSDDNEIEVIKKDNIIAVQWHPEEMTHKRDHLNIFVYFSSLLGQA